MEESKHVEDVGFEDIYIIIFISFPCSEIFLLDMVPWFYL